VILAAGLDGVNRKMPSGDRLDIDMYTEGHTVKDAKQLPQNLLDALRNFEADASLQSALGDEFSAAYTKLRYQEWKNFTRSLSQWERDNTLDC
ncbi:MAG: type III glutamate--ammonia ligase, partial [Granulosicoccus sp.]|nr:type III glutamate--ammonia ligase [Granulosicoccus sp.]